MLTKEEWRKAKRILTRSDSVLGDAIKNYKDFDLPVPINREPFEALIRAIAHQQLHGKAAETILGRFILLATADRVKKSGKFPTPQEIIALSDESIRGAGFSQSKVLAIRDIATKASEKKIPTRRKLLGLSNEEIIDQLVQLRGVGKWTVEMFLIFTLGRQDVLPVDDFGVKEGYRVLFKKTTQPTSKELEIYGNRWAPYRSIASLFLWKIADGEKEKKKNARVIS